MRNIRGKDTAPERIVRSQAHKLGLRFRLHVADLPGKPDMVLPRRRAVIFVNGCFWHRHDCQFAATPKTRVEFWSAKFAANQARDKRNHQDLEAQGWRVLVIWECETSNPETITLRLSQWFGPASLPASQRSAMPELP